MEKEKIVSIIESILFVSGEPVKKNKLAKILTIENEVLEDAFSALNEKYAQVNSGLMLLIKGDEVQMVSNADNTEYVENLVKGELQEALSPAALEVLSIIAYRGPIAKTEIEQIRGVNCSYTLRNLLLRGLIEKGDNPRDSRGYVYAISFELLKKLGVNNIKDLPDFETLSVDERIESIVNNKQD